MSFYSLPFTSLLLGLATLFTVFENLSSSTQTTLIQRRTNLSRNPKNLLLFLAQFSLSLERPTFVRENERQAKKRKRRRFTHSHSQPATLSSSSSSPTSSGKRKPIQSISLCTLCSPPIGVISINSQTTLNYWIHWLNPPRSTSTVSGQTKIDLKWSPEVSITELLLFS